MITTERAEELLREMTRGAMAAVEEATEIHTHQFDEDGFRQALMEAMAEVINVRIGVR